MALAAMTSAVSLDQATFDKSANPALVEFDQAALELQDQNLAQKGFRSFGSGAMSMGWGHAARDYKGGYASAAEYKAAQKAQAEADRNRAHQLGSIMDLYDYRQMSHPAKEAWKKSYVAKYGQGQYDATIARLGRQ